LLDRNDAGLEDTTGLDVLQGASVWCHYQPTDDQSIRSATERLQHPIIALSEKTGVYVQDNVMLAVGFEPVAVFQHSVQRTFPPSSVVLIE
jgi:dipeptidase E